MTPTQRTLKRLREEGWTAAVVEKWNPHAKVRHDLFGFADVLALKPGHRPLAVQATGGMNNKPARVQKIQDHAGLWLTCGGDVELWVWRKLKVKRGGKAVRWEVDRTRFTQETWGPVPLHTTET